MARVDGRCTAVWGPAWASPAGKAVSMHLLTASQRAREPSLEAAPAHVGAGCEGAQGFVHARSQPFRVGECRLTALLHLPGCSGTGSHRCAAADGGGSGNGSSSERGCVATPSRCPPSERARLTGR